MARVIIDESLVKRIQKVFSREEGNRVIDLMESLEANPHKGKALGHVAEFVIKEIKYKKYRFYFITDGHTLRFSSGEKLSRLIIRFVKMSDKKEQKKMIVDIKELLKSLLNQEKC